MDGVDLALFDGTSDRRVAAAGCARVLAAHALLPRRHCRRLREGGGRWKTSRATVAHGERASCAEKRTGVATYARRRKCENALELQGGGAPAESPGQFILSARESTLDKRRRRYGRAGVHTENAWKQTRRQRFGEGEEDTEDGNFTASHVG